ncbi:YlmH/Sll1252 family protein [Bengtsoniella intestinalis]|uniref:YlmH family RNA-binding protein n=1 Tax=Bengtsoniella intestinalis TaxID=3073143 RepID=UPI00391F7771
MDKATLLDRVGATGEERMLLANLLDRATQAQHRNIPTATEFLTPQEQALARDLLAIAHYGQDRYCFFGGYESAQRCVAVFLPDWMEPEQAMDEANLTCLRGKHREELTHRDVLGSLMGMGIERERIGDILIGDGHCDLIVSASLGDYLLQSWCSAGREKVTVSQIEFDQLHIPEQKVQIVKDTVMSLRLDAVAASGFSTSRGKMTTLVQGGKVQVNYKECAKADKLLQAGDEVSVRGLGKMKLSQIGGLSKKGRTGIVIERYL